MKRRDALRLLASGGCGALFASCVNAPAAAPTVGPIAASTVPPTTAPAAEPTIAPTTAPTAVPTAAPIMTPTIAPTTAPTIAPTAEPTSVPTVVTPPALAAAVDAAMQRAIQRNALPGGVALVRHKGAQIMLNAYGLARKYDSLTTVSADPIQASTDTLYDLASISKLLTTTAVMRLVEQDRLALDEPVAQWMPE